MSAIPAIPYDVVSGANPGFVPYVLAHGWDDVDNGWYPIPIREIIDTKNDIDAANDNLETISGYIAVIAGNEAPPNTQSACASIQASIPYVVKAEAGTVYGIASDKDVEVRDNTTAKIICPSTFIKCPAPVSFSQNITIHSQTPAVVTVWYV